MSAHSPRHSGCGEAAGCVPPLALSPVHDEETTGRTVTELTEEQGCKRVCVWGGGGGGYLECTSSLKAILNF